MEGIHGCFLLVLVLLVEEYLISAQEIEWLSPKHWLSKAKVPVYLSHGRDDVVVPYPQIEELKEMVPSDQFRGAFVTGFYDHTGTVTLRRLFHQLFLLPKEVLCSVQLIRAILDTGRE